MQPEHDYNPECNEEQDPQCKDEEFADLCLDEIEDWDDDFDIEHEPPGCAPVPDMACPLCGLDLSELDIMTPDAHVNRCLDGTGAEPQILPEQTEIPPLLPNVASQLRTGNPISSILGSIRSVITNLPLRPHPPSPSAPTTAAPKPPPKQFKPKVYRPCPFYKKMPDTNFTVDAFSYGAVEGCGAYFLSHFHSDHYGGLTSTWSHGLIYCSSITANLVISRLRVDEKWVRRLPMHKPTLVNGVTVTLMDANHCPGSVLFVFDLHSPKRRYLHTGDFRALPDMCLDPILCQPPNVPIDILYLDTTYSNPRYTFPSQKLVISETVRTINKELGLVNDTVVPPKPAPVKKANIMESWLKRESGNAQKLVTMSTKPAKMSKSAADWSRQMETNRVVICVGTYLIGKERVWMAVAKALRSKVFVQPAKLQILSCLEDQEIIDMLTSDPREAQVHLMHMGSDMSPEPLQEYLDKLSPTFTRLIAIRPTGWTFSGGPKKDSVSTTDITPEQTPTTLQLRPSYTSPMVKIYPVPYSEHSSFNELAGFVRSLNILRIIPTVGVGSEKGRHAMSEWFERWEQERRRGIGWL
ncbi:DNA break repair nuclease [Mortierella antarctica]|nr:DNA break repair nuclease [Mortierella antarctica]